MRRRSFFAPIVALYMVACGSPPPPPQPPTAAPAPVATSAPTPAPSMVKVESAVPDLPPIELIKNAIIADQNGDLEACMTINRAVIAREDTPRTRLHLASCETRRGQLVAAYSDTERALSLSEQKNDPAALKVARQRLGELDARTPSLKVSYGSNVTVAIDDASIHADEKRRLQPGIHTLFVTKVSAPPNTPPGHWAFEVHERDQAVVRIDDKGAITGDVTGR